MRYSHDGPEPAGTLGAIRRALPLLGDRFLVLYGDTYLRLDYAAVEVAWRASGLPAVMTVLRNEGRGRRRTSTAAGAAWLATTSGRRPRTCAGSTMASAGSRPARWTPLGPKSATLAALYARLADRGELMGFQATERFYTIGTPRPSPRRTHS